MQQEPGLVPIEVVADPADPVACADRQLRLVTRAGHRIEGLSLADVVELVRMLGRSRGSRGRAQIRVPSAVAAEVRLVPYTVLVDP
jgi:hypothetical protein